MEKELRTRVCHKHDTEANWKKATGFVPKNGEMIVYDIDENFNYQRIKIGDGVKNINELIFVTEKIYKQNEAPTDAEEGALWLDMDEEAAVSGGMGGADWNAHEGEPGHVLNRPFGKTFVEVLPTTQLEVIDGTEKGVPGLYIAEISGVFPLESDTNLKVTMNGVSYDTKYVSIATSDDEIMSFAGNWSLLNEVCGTEFEDTGEPFLFSSVSFFTANNVTLSVLAEKRQTISYEYLPKVPWIYFRPPASNPESEFMNLTVDEMKILSEAVNLGNININASVILGKTVETVRVPMRICEHDGGYNLTGLITNLVGVFSLYIRIFNQGDGVFSALYYIT